MARDVDKYGVARVVNPFKFLSPDILAEYFIAEWAPATWYKGAFGASLESGYSDDYDPTEEQAVSERLWRLNVA